jgi:hypothetical protein
LLLRGHRPPARFRIRLVDEAGAVDELLVVAQRHVRFLRLGCGGEECADPAHLARRRPAHHRLPEGVGAHAAPLLALRIDPAQRPRVRRAAQADDRFILLVRLAQRFVDVADLLLAPFLQENFLKLLVTPDQQRLPARQQDLTIGLRSQWLGAEGAVDDDTVTRLDVDTVVHEEPGELLDAGVRHTITILC